MMRRAGEMPLDTFLESLGGTLSQIVNSPARARERINASPQEMSRRAPFVDAAQSIEPVNPNVFVSYYPYGAIIGLALDLELRQRFPGQSLDTYMRQLWRSHGAPERPYSAVDLQLALGTLTGDADYALRFFQAYVGGSALPDFAPLLTNAGLTLRKANPDRGWIGGEAVTAGGPAVTLSQPPATGTPLFLAGIDRGDRIVGLGRITITSIADWQSAVTRLKPGEAVEIRYSQRGRDHIGTITPLADPKLEIVRSETLGHPLTARQREFRTAWLGGN
jgi:predicted metalloprotease with PDZ domain